MARPQIIKVTLNSYFPFHCPTMMVLCPEHIWNPIFFLTSSLSYSGLSSHPLSPIPSHSSFFYQPLPIVSTEYLKSLNQIRFPKTLLQWRASAIKIKFRFLKSPYCERAFAYPWPAMISHLASFSCNLAEASPATSATGFPWPLTPTDTVARSCQTLYDPLDCSLSGSSLHGISQERTLECVAISSSRGSSWPKDPTRISCTASGLLTHWISGEAPIIAQVVSWDFLQFPICWLSRLTRTDDDKDRVYILSTACYWCWPLLSLARSPSHNPPNC